MNITLNKIRITEDIKKENLFKFKVGQQFLVLEEKDLDYSDETYHNVQTLFLTEILMNAIYRLEGVNNNIDPYLVRDFQEKEEDEEEKELDLDKEPIGIEYNPKTFEDLFLVLDDKIQIKLESISGAYNIAQSSESEKEIYNKFKSMRRDFEYIDYIRDVDYKNKEVKFYLIYPIGDNYICYYIYNIINTDNYYWRKTDDIYLIDKEFTYSIKLDFSDNNKFFDILKTLSQSFLYNYEKFMEIYYPGNNFDIQDYLKNPAGISTVLETFGSISFIGEDYINKVFNPLYQDDSIKFKGYFDSRFYSFCDGINYDYSYKLGGNTYDKSSLTSIAIRKAENIKKYLRKETHADIYTGNYIYNSKIKPKIDKEYEDAGGIIYYVHSEENNSYSKGHKEYFTLLDGLYVEANRDEQRDIEDRKKMVEQLTNPGVQNTAPF